MIDTTFIRSLQSSPLLGLTIVLLVVASILLYIWALPKPLKGIPYNVHAARHILGDGPALQHHIKKTGEMWSWCAEQCHVHNSPIVQCFVRPFSKPWIIISDFRESQDIMTRRTREFDRSRFHKEVAGSVSGDVMPKHDTNDEWKLHRKLMNETMSTTFLRSVFAPQMHQIAGRVMQLWSEKVRLVGGHPFSIYDDLFRGAMDAIWDTTFGSEIGTTKTQVEYLTSLKSIPLPIHSDEAAKIPKAEDPADFLSVLEVTESAKYATQSPMPALGYWVAKKTNTSLRAAIRRKDALITARLEAAWAKHSNIYSSDDESKSREVTSAIELIVKREMLQARKESRTPDWNKPIVRDELFSFILAGHETSSTTLCWGVKLLTRYPHVQSKLRAALYAHHQRAYECGEIPTAEEIVTSEVPYLAAVIEEIHRCSTVAPAMPRQATVDTEILGHFIPKGTEIFMMINGPGFIQRAMPIPESHRSATSQAAKTSNRAWDDSNITEFMPERWLIRDDDAPDSVRFDARAGPSLPFGAGPRICFGKKLASIELDIVLTLLIWKFELRPIPEKYASWSSKDGLTHQPAQCYARLASVPTCGNDL